MAIDVEFNTITSGYNTAKINTNFQRIDTALQDGLSRSGEGPNQMEADLDMNDNDILNIRSLEVESLIVDGEVIVPEIVMYTPADNSVSTVKVQDLAITAAKIALNAVTNEKMADNAVGAAEVIDASLTKAKMSYILTTAATVTVKTVGGTFTTVEDALDYLKGVIFADDASLVIDVDVGDWTINSYVLRHPDSNKVVIRGATVVGTIPTGASMTSTYATDIAATNTALRTKITITGVGSTGFAITRGLTFENILVESPLTTRYPIAVGNWITSYNDIAGYGIVKFKDSAIFGGVWGILAHTAHVVTEGRTLFAYQGTTGVGNQGGPFILIDSTMFQVSTVAATIGCHMYGTVDTGTGIYLTHSRLEAVNNVLFYGPMQVGVYATNGSFVNIGGCTMDGVELALSADMGSTIRAYSGTFSDSTYNVSAHRTASGFPTLSPVGVYIGVGEKSQINITGSTFANIEATHFIWAGSEGSVDFSSGSVNGSLFATAFIIASNFGQVTYAATLATPQGGSSDAVTASLAGKILRNGAVGTYTYTPTVNTGDANGSWMG